MRCVHYIAIIILVNSFSAQETYEKVEVVVDHSAELPCSVTPEAEDDKLTVLAWYRDNSSTAFYSRDFRVEDEVKALSPSSRYKLVAAESEGLDKLQITAVNPLDAGVYHCLADFASSPALKTYVQLVVIEPPQRLWVVHENGTRVATATTGANTSRNIGPYFVGDTVRLFCVVFGGKPQSSLSWWAEQRLLKESSTPLSEHRVRSELAYGPLQREDHGRVLSCAAKNTDHMRPLTIDVTIDMLLPPELVSVRVVGGAGGAGGADGRARAGDVVPVQCRVLGARPLPDVLWRLNDRQLVNLEQNIVTEPSQRLVVNEIQLTIDKQYDESSMTCCVPANRRNDDEYFCAEPLHLTVFYLPTLKIILDDEPDNTTISVIKGSNISMNCTYQANPSVYQLIWFHGDDIISRNPDTTERTLEPILELVELSETDAGEYACAATNDEGSTYSEPVVIDVTYPAYCEDESIAEYGLDEGESINITCNVKANPEPTSYRWMLVDDAVDVSKLKTAQSRINLESEDNVMLYERPKHTPFSTIFCWGINNVPTKNLPHTPCTFLVTDETIPRPPTNCVAVQNDMKEITVTCDKGHDGGLPQNFTFAVKSLDSEEQLLSIISQEPKFMIQEPKYENYMFVIMASNAKGNSKVVQIDKDSIEFIDPEETVSAVPNITTLALALCSGVALVALAACGLVLCARDRSDRSDQTPRDHPPLCAYNTEESNCETYHDSDEGNDCNVRRTESFRRAVSKYPSQNYDVRRTSSFHSTRYMQDIDQDNLNKCNDVLRHSANCRVHSMQNINRKRDMDILCDHLVMHIPPETNYNNVPSRTMNTFYTMPRKTRHKLAKELSDDRSEITQTSDGFSLPPPPDEFGTYRAGTRIKDMPSKPAGTYTTIIRKNSVGKEPKQQYSNVIISPMNTVGLPTVSGGQSSVYTYPDFDSQGHQVNTNPFEEDSS